MITLVIGIILILFIGFLFIRPSFSIIKVDGTAKVNSDNRVEFQIWVKNKTSHTISISDIINEIELKSGNQKVQATREIPLFMGTTDGKAGESKLPPKSSGLMLISGSFKKKVKQITIINRKNPFNKKEVQIK